MTLWDLEEWAVGQLLHWGMDAWLRGCMVGVFMKRGGRMTVSWFSVSFPRDRIDNPGF